MNDRELLELAAKAAGIEFEWKDCQVMTGEPDMYGVRKILSEPMPFLRSGMFWNPIIDDSAALRLAVKLHMSVHTFVGGCEVGYDDMKGGQGYLRQDDGPDGDMHDDEVVRRAIVRAAAEMGRVEL